MTGSGSETRTRTAFTRNTHTTLRGARMRIVNVSTRVRGEDVVRRPRVPPA